jgi:hypothetical protein
MDKKPLIVISLCAVVLLVLGSLSNVVGYQSVKSTTVNDSPLFQTRTQRAISSGSNSNILSSRYLGKGFTIFLFPLQDSYEDLIKKCIIKIRAMDESTFHRFISTVVNKIQHNDNLKDLNVKDVINGLYQIRESNQDIIVYKDSNGDRITYLFNFYISVCWIPGCYFIGITFLILLLLAITIFMPDNYETSYCNMQWSKIK